MSSLRKRKWSTGKTTWSIRYRHEGKMKSFNIGETDRRTAEKVKTKFDNQFAQGIIPQDITASRPEPVEAEPKLSQLAVWTREYAETNKDRLTSVREQHAFTAYIQTLGDLKLSEISPAIIESYKAKRLKSVTPSTVNIEIRMLNTALAQAHTLGWLKEEFPHRFRQIQLPDAEEPEALTEEEIGLLLQTEDAEFRNYLTFLLLTGVRRNEALGCTWEDIDFSRKQIVIRGEVGKMGKRRTVPINSILEETLKQMPGDRTGLLFPNYGPNQISMKFRRVRRHLGLRASVTLHSLRSTFACHLIQNGVDIYSVSRLLGHSSVKVTEKHYLRLNSKDATEAVETLTYVPIPAAVKKSREEK